MRIGDKVLYKELKAEIIQTKWGLYCIRFIETRKQIWVTRDSLKRYDF